MQLINQAAVNVQTVMVTALVTAQRSENAVGLLHENRVGTGRHTKPRLQARGAIYHLLGVLPGNLRLVTSSGGAVYLSARLTVCRQQVEANAGCLRRLALLPGHLVVSCLESAVAFLVDPAEHRGQPEDLPGRKLQALALAGPFTLNVWQQLDKLAYAVGQSRLKPVRELRRAFTFQIIELALARKAHPLTGRDLTVEHLPYVLHRNGNVVSGHQMLSNPPRSSWPCEGAFTLLAPAGVRPNSLALFITWSQSLLRIWKYTDCTA